MGQTSNPSLAWKKVDVFKINDDDDELRKNKLGITSVQIISPKFGLRSSMSSRLTRG